MTNWGYTYEGGSNGVTIATGGSGSGNPWDVVTIGGSAAATYDNTHVAIGSLAGKYSTGVTSTTALTQWATATLGTPAVFGFRVDGYFTGVGTATLFMRGLASAAQKFRVLVTSTGKVQISDSANAAAAVTVTNSIPVNSYFSAGGFINVGATGACSISLFTNSTDTVAVETVAGSGNFVAGNFDACAFGIAASGANLGPYWLDNIQLNDTGTVPGPASAGGAVAPFAVPGPHLQAVSRASTY